MSLHDYDCGLKTTLNYTFRDSIGINGWSFCLKDRGTFQSIIAYMAQLQRQQKNCNILLRFLDLSIISNYKKVQLFSNFSLHLFHTHFRKNLSCKVPFLAELNFLLEKHLEWIIRNKKRNQEQEAIFFSINWLICFAHDVPFMTLQPSVFYLNFIFHMRFIAGILRFFMLATIKVRALNWKST